MEGQISGRIKKKKWEEVNVPKKAKW